MEGLIPKKNLICGCPRSKQMPLKNQTTTPPVRTYFLVTVYYKYHEDENKLYKLCFVRQNTNEFLISINRIKSFKIPFDVLNLNFCRILMGLYIASKNKC